MPGFHKIRAHRIACLALYKAILSHCKYLPFSNNVKKQAQLEIHKKFRKDRRIQGLENIRTVLRSAYENEALFRGAATGNPTLTALLTEKLQAHKKLKKAQKAISQAPSRPPPTFPPPTPPKTRRKRLKRLAASIDPVARENRKRAIRILLRRLPSFGNASLSTFFRRPGRKQSTSVSMVIKRRVEKRQQRIDLSDKLEEWIQIAHEEDDFDRMMGEYDRRSKWVFEARNAYDEVKSRMRRMEERVLELTKRYQEIIDNEKARKEDSIRLYKREKRKRSRQKKREEKEAQDKIQTEKKA